MSAPLEVLSDNPFINSHRSAKTKKSSYKVLIGAWLFLVVCGFAIAILYTNHLKQQISSDLAKQTQDQLQLVQADYQKQITDLKDSVSHDMVDLQSKVDQLNQLLAFTKDNANSKTDNSNQLYTQLADVKKKLEELQKNLDVLK